jgi:multiple sugar transport system substrate-binding protein
VIPALAACGATGDAGAPAGKPAQLAPARLIVYIGGTQDSHDLITGKLFPAFQSMHSGMTLEYNPGNLALEKLRTLAAAGETPEIYMNGAAFAPAIADGGFAVALDARLKTWGKLPDFFPTSLHASSWNGKQWGLPMMIANRTHLWRKNVLSEAGISKVPATWEEAVDAARRSTRVADGVAQREGGIKPDGWAYFNSSILSAGKTLFRDGKAEFAGAEGIASLEYLADLFAGIRPPGTTPATGNDASKFGTGVLAHTWGNMNAVRDVTRTSPQDLEHIVVADPPVPGTGKYRLPSGARVRPITLNFSDWISIGSMSKAQDQAWALMQFLVEPENLLAYGETRYFQPPRKSAANQGFMKQPLLQRMVEVFDKHGHAQIRVPDQAIFQQTTQLMAEDVYAGKLSAKQSVEEAARKLQAEVDKAGFKGTTL